MPIKPNRKTKSPPMLSHEFVIQNHADIVSCVAMVFVVGIMFQVSQPLASIFVTLSHNASDYGELQYDSLMRYTNGMKDIGAVFFYSLIAIIIHAVIQEYLIDKFTKKLHLSKTRLAKFNECGQMFFFSSVSAFWAMYIIYRDGLLNGASKLWEDYPKTQSEMTFQHKAFFIAQMGYWLHSFPELYILKVRKGDLMSKIMYPAVMLGLTSVAYITNYTRIALVLLLLRCLDDAIFNACKLLHYADKIHYASKGFRMWNFIFVGCRLVSCILAILTFQYGLAGLDNHGFDPTTGNFNSGVFRFNALVGIILSQGYLVFTFTQYQLCKMKEDKVSRAAKKKMDAKKTQELVKNKLKKTNKEKKRDEEVKLLPEADQQHIKRRKK